MAQQQVQQEAVRLASQHQLGVLQKEYGKWSTVWLLIFFIVFTLAIFFSLTLIIYIIITDPSAHIPPVVQFLLYTIPLVGFLVSCSTICGIYRVRHSRSFLYEYGYMRVKYAGKQIVTSEVIHWRDIAIIWHRVELDYFDGNVDIAHIYTLQRLNGTLFEEQIQNSMRGKRIEQIMLPYLLPQAISTYQQGLPVVFGPFTLHTDGIEYEGRILLWSDFDRLKMSECCGKVSILQKGDRRFLGITRSWATVPYAQVPNLALFHHLILSITVNEPESPAF